MWALAVGSIGSRVVNSKVAERGASRSPLSNIRTCPTLSAQPTGLRCELLQGSGETFGHSLVQRRTALLGSEHFAEVETVLLVGEDLKACLLHEQRFADG
jgi:hypothetical protein